MKRYWQIILRMCVAASLIGVLSGCATLYPKDRMEGSSTDYNMLVETVQNRMLLLNIVRASMRRPMYFTSFNQLGGNLEYNYSSGALHLPFASFRGGTDVFSIAPTVSYSTKPSFMVNVLDSAEFISALMNPVSMDAAYYYLKEGWHKEELWHLLIQRIEIETSKDKYVNSPADREQFEKGFQDNLRKKFLKYDLVQDKPEQSEKSKSGEKDKGECLFKCDGKALSIGKEAAGDKDKQDEKGKSKYHFEYTEKPLLENVEKSLTVTKADTAGGYELRDPKKKDKDNNPELIYTIYLRSPEAILYYLGQILRAEAQNDFTPTIKLEHCEKDTKLFVVRKANDDDKAPAVSVDYENTKYVIPGNRFAEHGSDSDVKCPLDSSMHVLSFISQIIQLQKSAKDLPATNIFNVIGR